MKNAIQLLMGFEPSKRAPKKKAVTKKKAAPKKKAVTKKAGFEVYSKKPLGWVYVDGAQTTPNGYRMISNNKSRFDKNNTRENALVKAAPRKKAVTKKKAAPQKKAVKSNTPKLSSNQRLKKFYYNDPNVMLEGELKSLQILKSSSNPRHPEVIKRIRETKREIEYAKKKIASKKKAGIKYFQNKAKKKAAIKKKAAPKKAGHIPTRIAMDKKRQAKKPGKRISKDGNVYYESRANRSDKKKWL